MKIALTFDVERDIPYYLDTDFGLKIGLIKILDLLDEFQIKGTFFCTGNVAQRYPQVIDLIDSREHEIACHGFNHERMYQLSYEECKRLISKNKRILEEQCKKSKIIGFRAPYLKPPDFIFALLDELGFKYDSSIPSRKISKFWSNHEILEFHPLLAGSYFFFRLPLFYYFLKKKILKRELSILYFHPWEAIDVKKLIQDENKPNQFKNIHLRIDRWKNTGDEFIERIRKFIIYCLEKKAEFVTLKQLTLK